MRIFYVLLLIACHNISMAQLDEYIRFNEVKVAETCIGATAYTSIRANYDSETPIDLVFQESNITSIQIEINDQTYNPGDTIYAVDHKKARQMKVKFDLENTAVPPYLLIKQLKGELISLDTIKVHIGCFQVKMEDQVIRVSDSCIDTVYLSFPFVATQTDLSIYKLVNGKYEPEAYLTYYCCSWGNHFRVDSREPAKYMVKTSGCFYSGTPYYIELR